MIKKRTILAFGLGAAAAWYYDPVSGPERRETLRRHIDSASDRTETLREHLPHRDFPDTEVKERPARSTSSDATSSLQEVLAAARRHGATTDMSSTPDGLVRCGSCAANSQPEHMARDWVHRLEGTSDPDEMLTASAVRCPHCGATGVLVLPFGPLADEVEANISRALPEPEHADMAPIA